MENREAILKVYTKERLIERMLRLEKVLNIIQDDLSNDEDHQLLAQMALEEWSELESR